MSTWKTREETYHGSKWGYAVVALVIAIVLTLLSSIFYLMGEGIRNNPEAVFTVSVASTVTIIIIVLIVLVLIKVGIISSILNFMWAALTNIYILVVTVILVVVLILALSAAVYSNIEIDLTNPIIIGILVVLLIIFVPFAIFLIDQFSYEHE